MTTHTEAAEQYIKNRLGGLVEVDLDAKFDEVNINDEKYKLLKDDDDVGIFDRNGRLFRNNNGDVKLTTGIPPLLIRPENTIENSVDLYDFSKPNQENGASFTEAGRRFYTRQMDENATEEDKTARLIEIEKQLNSALVEDQNRRDKTVKNGSDVPLIIASNNKVNTNNSEDDKENQDANTGTNFEPPEFGKVDAILTKLSLRGLKYPIDADYGNTQDYIQINQFKFRAPSKGIFFPDNKKTNASDVATILKEGVRTGTPKEKAIGLVKLPMPNSLADSNNVSWGPDQLNALTAAFAQGAIGVGGDFIKGLNTFLDNNSDVNNPFELAGNAIGSLTTGATEFLGRSIKSIRKEAPGVLSNQNINTLARGVLGSTILSALQFQVSPEALLARGQGIIPNNNLALLFNSPTLREFTFAWKMSPRSKEEAIRVNNILRFFKQGMAPKKQSNSTGGGRSFFLGTPNVFDIHFKTTKRKANFFNSIDRNDSVLRIKTCACTGAAVSYTPEGMWNAYEDGQPVAITLTLRFAELEPIFDTDYDENDLNFSPNRKDLLPVPIDAVGY